MVIHGHSWSFMVIHGHSWSFMVIHGHSWSFMVIHGHSTLLRNLNLFLGPDAVQEQVSKIGCSAKPTASQPQQVDINDPARNHASEKKQNSNKGSLLFLSDFVQVAVFRFLRRDACHGQQRFHFLCQANYDPRSEDITVTP